jgi:hypothetical protein
MAMSRSADGVAWRAEPEDDEAHRIALLSNMIRAHGLDPVKIEEAHPIVMRALKTGCSLCALPNQCMRALRERTVVTAGATFCLNAPVLEALADYEHVAEAAATASTRATTKSRDSLMRPGSASTGQLRSGTSGRWRAGASTPLPSFAIFQGGFRNGA